MPVPAPPPVDCSTLPNPVYVQCGDTQNNLMLSLGRSLRDNSEPITLVWVTSGSCNNIDLMYNGGKIGDGSMAGGVVTAMSYVPSIAENPTWTPAVGPSSCALPAGGVTPDIGNSALFNSACTTEAPPANVALTQGGRQAYVLVVPRGSTATAITAAMGYFLFGFGPALLAQDNASIEPWTDPMQLFIRPTTKSTLLAWAANLGITPATKFQGVPKNGSPDVVAALESSTNPGAAIGILGAEVYDAVRDKLQSLAFQAYHQYAAYFPDSTATSRDKKNLRDGHYTVWSPTIWMDFVDGSGAPVSPTARYVIDLIAGLDTSATGLPAPSFDPQVNVAKVGLVPDCAMRVTRSFEGGPLSLYTPPEGSCTCKYESTVDVSSCATCDASTPCATGVCRNGYCEAF
jgi:hypothetical protein